MGDEGDLSCCPKCLGYGYIKLLGRAECLLCRGHGVILAVPPAATDCGDGKPLRAARNTEEDQ